MDSISYAPLVIQFVTALLTVGGVLGVLQAKQTHQEEKTTEIKKDLKNDITKLEVDLKEDFSRLERKMDKHNNIVERLCHVEDRSKSNTHRLDKLEGEKK